MRVLQAYLQTFIVLHIFATSQQACYTSSELCVKIQVMLENALSLQACMQ